MLHFLRFQEMAQPVFILAPCVVEYDIYRIHQPIFFRVEQMEKVTVPFS